MVNTELTDRDKLDIIKGLLIIEIQGSYTRSREAVAEARNVTKDAVDSSRRVGRRGLRKDESDSYRKDKLDKLTAYDDIVKYLEDYDI